MMGNMVPEFGKPCAGDNAFSFSSDCPHRAGCILWWVLCASPYTVRARIDGGGFRNCPAESSPDAASYQSVPFRNENRTELDAERYAEGDAFLAREPSDLGKLDPLPLSEREQGVWVCPYYPLSELSDERICEHLQCCAAHGVLGCSALSYYPV